VTVIVAAPAAIPFTVAVLPLPVTVATAASLLLQLNVPPDGLPVAVKVCVVLAPQILSGFGLSVTVQDGQGVVLLTGPPLPASLALGLLGREQPVRHTCSPLLERGDHYCHWTSIFSRMRGT
jgi:hypothetical protein